MVTSHLETPQEERVNSLTHGLGFLVSVVALVAAVWRFWWQPVSLLAVSMFGAGVTFMFLASTLFHGCSAEGWKRRLHRLDHVGILWLIAASYTPFGLLALPSEGGRVLAGMWAVALAGTVFVLAGGVRFPRVTTLTYLGMGWVSLFLLGTLRQTLPPSGLAWLVAGGVAYTIGTYFYATHKFRFSHAVWHLFVMLAASCHYVSIWITARASSM